MEIEKKGVSKKGGDSGINNDAAHQVSTVLGVEKIIRNKEYYQNPEYVKHDLEGFAKSLGKSVIKLNSKDKGNIKCFNGEIVSWRVYMSNASIALGGISILVILKLLNRWQFFYRHYSLK